MRLAALASGAFAAFLTACAAPLTADLASVAPAAVERNWAKRETLVSLAPRPDVRLDMLVLRPTGVPVGGLVVLTGGEGNLGLRSRPPGWLGGNFLVRSRMRFAAEGFVVATLDAPSDQSSGMRGFRLSAEHVADLAATVARLRQETKGQIWLVGTSMGSISAANGAREGAAGADGIVLTSTVTVSSGNAPFSVNSLPLEDVRVPVLVFQHWRDTCIYSSWHGTEALLQRFKNARKVERITVDGGDTPRSAPCEAYAAHGYVGIEAPVVTLIADWIKAASR